MSEPLARTMFRPDVQGLRGIAVLIVVLFHSGFALSGGFVGVDVFFVVSGFVITRLLVRELGESNGLSLANFYSRRARRLLPAFVTFSLVTMAASVLLLSPIGSQTQQHAIRTGISASLFSGNWFLYFRGGGYWGPNETLNPFLHTWSLGVEEQFYLLLPAALLLLWRSASGRAGRKPRSSALILAVGGVSVASFLLSWALSNGVLSLGSPERLAFYGTPTRVWEFGAGAFVALIERRLNVLSVVPRYLLAGFGVVALAGACVFFDGSTVFPGTAALAPVLGTMALIAAGGVDGPVRTALAWRPLTWIGDRSYGWYLWHWPAIVFASVLWPATSMVKLLAAALSILPTMFSFRYIEQRVRLNRGISGLRALRMAAACILTPLLLGGGALIGASRGWGLEAPQEWADRGVSFTEGCHAGGASRSEWPKDRCLFKVNGSKGLVLLLGDSHAAAASSAIVKAGNSIGYDVGVWTRSSCPLLAPGGEFGDESCRWWQQQAFDLIAENHPDLVVVVNRTPAYTLATEMVTDDGNHVGGKFSSTQDRTAALQRWDSSFTDTLKRLSGMKTRALVVADVPNWGLGFPDGSVSILRPEPEPPVIPKAKMSAHRKGWIVAEKKAIEKFPNSTQMDPFDLYCQGKQCSPKVAGRWNFFDDNHVTRIGSLEMVPALRSAMRHQLNPTSG